MKDSHTNNKVVSLVGRNQTSRNPMFKPYAQTDTSRRLVIKVDPRHTNGCEHTSFNYVNLITQELNLWRKHLDIRQISGLELFYSPAQFEPYEITCFIHKLAKEFNTSLSNYRFILPPEHLEPQILALFKGLGFRQCQFVLEHAQSTSLTDLQNAIETARSLTFDTVGVQITHTEGVENLTQSIHTIKNTYHADYVFIGGTSERLFANDIQPSCTLFEDDLSQTGLDVLALGPSSKSELNGRKFESFNDSARYITAIESGTLPIAPTNT